MWISFNKEVKIGDLLTIATILISVTSVLVSWHIDRQITLSQKANNIRLSAIDTLLSLEKWRDITNSVFDEMQPLIIDISDIVVKGESRYAGITAGRDMLWRQVNVLRSSAIREIRIEGLRSGYLHAFPYYPELRPIFITTNMNLEQVFASYIDELSAEIEVDVISFIESKKTLQTADVGNKLRATTARIREQYNERFSDEVEQIESLLVAIINASDAQILR